MPDPTTTYRLTTAEAPEWAAAVTSDARDAEIARLQAENRDLDTANGHLSVMVQEDGEEIERLKRELADVKAECCRLVCRNGDLASEIAKRDARLGRLAEARSDVEISIKPRPGEYLGHVADQAATLAEHNQRSVRFTFNGTPGVANPGDTADEVWRKWNAQREADQAEREAAANRIGGHD